MQFLSILFFRFVCALLPYNSIHVESCIDFAPLFCFRRLFTPKLMLHTLMFAPYFRFSAYDKLRLDAAILFSL